MSHPILTAQAMRAAEEAVIAAGTPVQVLMERAGACVAEFVWRMAAGAPVLVACGPGNNGGDGYVAARLLRQRGAKVRVAALADPRTEAARVARAGWGDMVEALDDVRPAPILVDCLFGTGLTRSLGRDMLGRLARGARRSIAVDLPSGVGTDDGALLGTVPAFDATIALGALKPAHLLQPAAHLMGGITIGDIGLGPIQSPVTLVERPCLTAPGPRDHKYSRGMVMVIGGGLAGAGCLAANAAFRAGAGMVRLYGARGGLDAIMTHPIGDVAQGLTDRRLNAVLIGPGLTPDEEGNRLFDLALASGHPLVIDAGALRLAGKMGVEALASLGQMPILTPHDGEFDSLFGETVGGSKIERAIAAAQRSGAVVVHKGPDTVIAAPDGQAAVAPVGSPWLSTGGTGDVLAGIIAAMRARGLDAFGAAVAGVWLHGEAARLAGPAFVADDLSPLLGPALVQCTR